MQTLEAKLADANTTLESVKGNEKKLQADLASKNETVTAQLTELVSLFHEACQFVAALDAN